MITHLVQVDKRKSKTNRKLKPHTHGVNVRVIQSKLILGKVQMKANLLYG